MACNCKHNQDEIERENKSVASLRELFIKRMTVDSESQDKRRRDYNQAIFHYEPDEDVDSYNEWAERNGIRHRKQYGETYPVWSVTTMDMVLQCFDNAAKDLRRTWCDVDDCRRK